MKLYKPGFGYQWRNVFNGVPMRDRMPPAGPGGTVYLLNKNCGEGASSIQAATEWTFSAMTAAA